MPWACPRRTKPSRRARWALKCSGSRASATWQLGCCPGLSITPRCWRRRAASATGSRRCWRLSLAVSDRSRVSVLLVDVSAGLEPEFLALAREFDAALTRKGYGREEVIRDEGVPLRFYTIRRWTDADAAGQGHGAAELQGLTARLHRIARFTHVVNGVRRPDPKRLLLDDRRAHIEPDRRT